MGGAEENRGKLSLSLQTNGLSRDLPFRLWNQIHLLNRNEDREEEKEGEELQLSLGLSMNGRFGTDPTRKKLRRSSSISNLVFPVGAGSTHQTRGVAFDGHAPLGRTRSLPIEVEAACRRHMELQSMKQMEARKKRMEKLKSLKDKDNCSEEEFVYTNVNVQRLDLGIINGSQRNSSSGFSGLQCQQIEGVKQDAEVKSHAHKDQRELLKGALPDMPYVSTNGNETGGKKIEGFLYRYRKGEDVKIVCVCHGFFLSPAEFVKHGGGGEVEHPMKHIVVNPFPFF